MRQPHVRQMGLKRPPEMFVSTAATNAGATTVGGRGRRSTGVQLYLHRGYRALHAAGSDPVWPMYCFDELKAQFESLGSAVQLSDQPKDSASPVVRKHGQRRRLGGATAGRHGLYRPHLKAWGCPPHS